MHLQLELPSPTSPMANKPKKLFFLPPLTYLNTTLLFLISLSIPALLLLHFSSTSPCSYSSPFATVSRPWSGDLRAAQFAWNSLFDIDNRPPPASLKVAVFSRKWPLNASPGGMERHALTLHGALADRGHSIHVYTSGPPPKLAGADLNNTGSPILHFSMKSQWDYHEAWASYEAENRREPFDVVHSESVALPNWLAKSVPNLVVSWHGFALEALQSKIYQDLIRKPDEPMSPATSDSLNSVVQRILDEIRFFHKYAHHVAISDSSGEMLRDVYQIPNNRVHVILNGIDDQSFSPNHLAGKQFRARYSVPENASLVMGVSGRLVKDKGHPLLHEAFSKLIAKNPGVYLIIAGSGPWEQRYKELGPQVLALGALRPNELRGFYNALDVFVNPTLRPQGLDLTLMEAMMCGKPILATRFPSIKGTVIVNDEFGFMFTPNVEALVEGLEKVAEEGPRRLAERGKACHKYAASMFTASKMALAYERLFLCIENEAFCKYP